MQDLWLVELTAAQINIAQPPSMAYPSWVTSQARPGQTKHSQPCRIWQTHLFCLIRFLSMRPSAGRNTHYKSPLMNTSEGGMHPSPQSVECAANWVSTSRQGLAAAVDGLESGQVKAADLSQKEAQWVSQATATRTDTRQDNDWGRTHDAARVRCCCKDKDVLTTITVQSDLDSDYDFGLELIVDRRPR